MEHAYELLLKSSVRPLPDALAADDSGLSVNLLGGEPGVFSARFAERAGNGGGDAANRQELTRRLREAGLGPGGTAPAAFVCAIAFIELEPERLVEAQAECRGAVGLEESGDGGFGYDSMFTPILSDGRLSNRTFAELPSATKHELSHRGKALRALVGKLGLTKGVPALEARAVVKRYGSLTAVAGVDLSIASGESVALLGPNGAGKTTLVEMLEGLVAPDFGQILVDGLDWATEGSAIRGRLGTCLQDAKLPERLRVEETLELFCSFHGKGRDRAEELLSLVDLESHRKHLCGKLSGGQRQRLALACAIAGGPRILILDEPTTGVDPAARRQIWEILKLLRSQGATLLLTTHFMDEAVVLCDRVVLMESGRVLDQGTVPELLERGKVATLDDLFLQLAGRRIQE
jgi:non-canonical purine NTP pyrophosphatase (RdgB/HAM1 family)